MKKIEKITQEDIDTIHQTSFEGDSKDRILWDYLDKVHALIINKHNELIDAFNSQNKNPKGRKE